MKVRYTEVFYSLQGEGRFVGTPSVFLRLFGCNFQCAGFGMSPGEESEERFLVNLSNTVDKFEDLPLVTTGCDSYASWDPRFKKFATTTDIDGVITVLLDATPQGCWTQSNGQDVHLIITGGEPMLWQRIYAPLFKDSRMQDIKHITFETNTTQPLKKDTLEDLTPYIPHITWSCSPKLSTSGETWEDAIKPEVALSYYRVPNSDMYFKFVIEDERDMEEVLEAIEAYRRVGIECPVYCMPVGGCYEEYSKNAGGVAEAVMKYGLRYSPRLHSDLFGNAWGT